MVTVQSLDCGMAMVVIVSPAIKSMEIAGEEAIFVGLEQLLVPKNVTVKDILWEDCQTSFRQTRQQGHTVVIISVATPLNKNDK